MNAYGGRRHTEGDTDATQEARLAGVEEHVRQENRHDIHAVITTFGEHPEYEDTP